MDNCKVFRIEIKTVRISPRFLCLYGENERFINSKVLTIKYNHAKDECIRPG